MELADAKTPLWALILLLSSLTRVTLQNYSKSYIFLSNLFEFFCNIKYLLWKSRMLVSLVNQRDVMLGGVYYFNFNNYL